MSWRRVDLHIHTPASHDYQEQQVVVLDILRRAEERELDIIALTDHNSVRGYADLWREIEDLELLEFLGRMEAAEETRLREYRRLLSKILVLPGFEFTATFGFHVLAIFPERTSVRLMEHLLLLLGVPEDRFGSGEVGATSDVLRAYEILADHGALVIGAHVNSTHGIAMQGLRIGGQTKIAFTQDPHLHALEVTDLGLGIHRRSTARFFSGAKSEYPRRMHCIQGSDAHRLDRDPKRETNLGVGERATEILLPEVSFASLKAVFLSDEFDRTRPSQPKLDPVTAARLDGNTQTQAFHESMSTKKTGVSHVLRDIVALANTDGGTIYIGASHAEKRPLVGVADPGAAIAELTTALSQQVAPPLTIKTETIELNQKQVLVLHVARGADRPYALAPGAIYVRREGESDHARRDEIVALARGAALPSTLPPVTDDRGAKRSVAPSAPESTRLPEPKTLAPAASARPRQTPRSRQPRAESQSEVTAAPPPTAGSAPRLAEYEEAAAPDAIAPRTGVEVLYSYEQDSVTYYTLRDLRYHRLIHNVTRESPRRMLRSAIIQHEEQERVEDKARWVGDYGFLRSYRPRGGERRYNLAFRGDGDVRVFFGVSGEGLNEKWRAVIPTGTEPS